MKMHINRNGTIRDIQQDFCKAYPYLKIEFYKKAQRYGKKSSGHDRLRGSTPAADVIPHSSGEWLDISPQRAVGEVEKEFREISGLYAQVFRRSGNIWIETTHTDKWTLRLQNEEGKSSCVHLPQTRVDADLEDID